MVVGWGYNAYGPTDIPAGLTNAVALAAGGSHSLALKSDGTVVGWGRNDYGQIDIPVGLTNVTAIAAGYIHSLCIREND
jgi:alpha-tubulin suppressor-like RCC1 family protein